MEELETKDSSWSIRCGLVVQKHKPHYHFVMSNKEKSDNMFKGHGESSIKTYKRVVSEWIWSRTKIREDLGTS